MKTFWTTLENASVCPWTGPVPGCLLSDRIAWGRLAPGAEILETGCGWAVVRLSVGRRSSRVDERAEASGGTDPWGAAHLQLRVGLPTLPHGGPTETCFEDSTSRPYCVTLFFQRPFHFRLYKKPSKTSSPIENLRGLLP